MIDLNDFKIELYVQDKDLLARTSLQNVEQKALLIYKDKKDQVSLFDTVGIIRIYISICIYIFIYKR